MFPSAPSSGLKEKSTTRNDARKLSVDELRLKISRDRWKEKENRLVHSVDRE